MVVVQRRLLGKGSIKASESLKRSSKPLRDLAMNHLFIDVLLRSISSNSFPETRIPCRILAGLARQFDDKNILASLLERDLHIPGKLASVECGKVGGHVNQ